MLSDKTVKIRTPPFAQGLMGSAHPRVPDFPGFYSSPLGEPHHPPFPDEEAGAQRAPASHTSAASTESHRWVIPEAFKEDVKEGAF